MNFTKSKNFYQNKCCLKSLIIDQNLEPDHLAVPVSELPELSEEMVASPLDHDTAPSPPRLSLHARLHLQ